MAESSALPRGTGRVDGGRIVDPGAEGRPYDGSSEDWDAKLNKPMRIGPALVSPTRRQTARGTTYTWQASFVAGPGGVLHRSFGLSTVGSGPLESTAAFGVDSAAVPAGSDGVETVGKGGVDAGGAEG